MLIKKSKPNSNIPFLVDLVNEASNQDYVLNGEIHKNSAIAVILVGSQSDLASLTDKYEPGAVAYTAGFVNIWQLDTSGNWVEV